MPPKNIQTFLIDGTLEGVRIIELSDSSVKAFAVPRLKLADVKDRRELSQPALYLLLGGDGQDGYIGECENFYRRIKDHDQTKQFWDLAIAFVSNTNGWEKSDVKYLESRIIELAKETGSLNIVNKNVPARNRVHEFKLYSLGKVTADISLIASSLGYDLLRPDKVAKEQIWYCRAKSTNARGVFRGDKFIILAGSVIDISYAPSWADGFPSSLIERQQIFKQSGKLSDGVAELKENIAFKSPNTAGGFATGRNINAWTVWKDASGKTMDEVMRKGEV